MQFSPATLLLCLLALCAPLRLSAQAQGATGKPQVIVLKLDDVVANGRGGQPISERWLRVTQFLAERKLHASYGIIGYSLETDNQVYLGWIKDLQAQGQIEFWNHGYYRKRSEQDPREFEQSLEEQTNALKKTQELARTKLGFELRAFGPHWSGTNADTEKALDTCPEITSWFGLKPDAVSTNPQRYVFERVLALENPTFVPNFEKFKAVYEKAARGKPVLALQGHPDQWDEERWAGFVQIIDFLQAQGCVFMTPSEYLSHRAQAK